MTKDRARKTAIRAIMERDGVNYRTAAERNEREHAARKAAQEASAPARVQQAADSGVTASSPFLPPPSVTSRPGSGPLATSAGSSSPAAGGERSETTPREEVTSS